jgi:hypothetical protein
MGGRRFEGWIRWPREFARSLIAMALRTLFDFRRTAEIALIALSISPVPPCHREEEQAGGRGSSALRLMASLALLSIALVPGALEPLP